VAQSPRWSSASWRSAQPSREEHHRKKDRSVDVYIARLRQKLDEALPGRAYIHTHFGFGYRLSSE
jgi:DNA-binding response OmpR family regulator